MHAYIKGKKYVSSDYVASMSDVERKNRSRGNKTETIHKEWNMKENTWLWRDIFAAYSLRKQQLDISNNERSGKIENVLVPDVCVWALRCTK